MDHLHPCSLTDLDFCLDGFKRAGSDRRPTWVAYSLRACRGLRRFRYHYHARRHRGRCVR